MRRDFNGFDEFLRLDIQDYCGNQAGAIFHDGQAAS